MKPVIRLIVASLLVVFPTIATAQAAPHFIAAVDPERLVASTALYSKDSAYGG